MSDAGEDRGDAVAGLLVNAVVVLPTLPVAPDPGGMRHRGVEPVHLVLFRRTPVKRRLIGHGRSLPVSGGHPDLTGVTVAVMGRGRGGCWRWRPGRGWAAAPGDRSSPAGQRPSKPPKESRMEGSGMS